MAQVLADKQQNKREYGEYAAFLPEGCGHGAPFKSILGCYLDECLVTYGYIRFSLKLPYSSKPFLRSMLWAG